MTFAAYRKFACDQCDKRFIEAYHLTRHKFLIHSQETTSASAITVKTGEFQPRTLGMTMIMTDYEQAVGVPMSDI